MTPGAASGVEAVDVVVGLVALLAGYIAGSIPVAWYVARAAGAGTLTSAGRAIGSAAVWRVAGPGPGMLALTGDLAKGVVPVAIGIVTWSWGAGWAAGLGAVVGACWPALGRWSPGRPGGATGGSGGGDRAGLGTDPSTALAVLAGAAFALAPPAGVVGVGVAAVVLGAGRLLGRDAVRAAIGAGFGCYPIALLAVAPDAGRVGLMLVPYAVVLARSAVGRGRPEGDARPSP